MVFDILKSAVGLATNIVDKIFPDKLDEKERSVAILEMQKLIEERDASVVNAQRDIIVAELQQGDKFTKRARPMIVYVGLFAVVFNFVFLPFVNRIIEWIAVAKGTGLEVFSGLTPIDLPSDFWLVWGGVCSVYAIGRSAEKYGARNKLVGWITGNNPNGG